MRLYTLHGLTRYAGQALEATLTAGEQVELLRAHHGDAEDLLTELRRLVALASRSQTADAEFVAAALDEIDWPALVTALRELVDVEVELPCRHEKVVFASFGGYDARHGRKQVVENEECQCKTCGLSWEVVIESKAEGVRTLRRAIAFTLKPERSVYGQTLTFSNGELATSSSGAWRPQATAPQPAQV